MSFAGDKARAIRRKMREILPQLMDLSEMTMAIADNDDVALSERIGAAYVAGALSFLTGELVGLERAGPPLPEDEQDEDPTEVKM